MQTLEALVKAQFEQALRVVVGKEGADPMVRLAGDERFGDFQSNAAMGLAKQLQKNPREIAQQIMDNLPDTSLFEKTEIAGPGFINITLKNSVLAKRLEQMAKSSSLAIDPDPKPRHTVIDFSSPNLAKEMHVGHLRTTLTGEVIARVLEFRGHSVDRMNHVGDWGTQFGMLLQYIYEHQPEVLQNPESFAVENLEGFYKKAKARFDEDEDFKNAAREKVVLLQSGDAVATKVWQAFLKESLKHCHLIYDELGVRLEDKGESFYNPFLADVVKTFKDKALAKEDDGAVCVYLEGFQNRDGEPLPLIIQKKDGGYNYATTDLAAIRYRVNEQNAKRIIYVTDNRQEQHFKMVFAAARAIGWVPDDVELQHIGYGMVLGSDRKPFKTRDGGTVRLKDLLGEAVARAQEVIVRNKEERGQDLSDDQVNDIAKKVGFAAIKYSDLSHNLSSDYQFSWDKMLAMDGNTGPYMLYAYARVKSIGRKGQVDFDQILKTAAINLDHPTERQLAKVLNRFGDVCETVGQELRPILITEYLYQLSKAFSGFYDKKAGVSVLEAPDQDTKNSRLALCALTAAVLKTGLGLLSIEVLEEM
ncbi:MAG: arginine--tRNA ligase [Deltaproteobacteria bacterium]|nr:arginine--tRNA ligase [Deltaproteobacteria bacterium]